MKIWASISSIFCGFSPNSSAPSLSTILYIFHFCLRKYFYTSNGAHCTVMINFFMFVIMFKVLKIQSWIKILQALIQPYFCRGRRGRGWQSKPSLPLLIHCSSSLKFYFEKILLIKDFSGSVFRHFYFIAGYSELPSGFFYQKIIKSFKTVFKSSFQTFLTTKINK